MIVLLRDIFKVSENKTYKKGDKVSFTKQEETNLVNNGLAEFEKRKTKELKTKPKKK